MNNLKTFLTFDTSAKEWSISLFVDGTEVETTVYGADVPLSANLAVKVQDILHKNSLRLSDLDCFGLNLGPGSFTGLRVGIAFVKAVARSVQIPWFGFSLFELVENSGKFNGHVCFVLVNNQQISYQIIGDKNVHDTIKHTTTQDFVSESFPNANSQFVTSDETYQKMIGQSVFDGLLRRKTINVLDSDVTRLIGQRLFQLSPDEFGKYENRNLFYGGASDNK